MYYIYRDIKPENILTNPTENILKIIDFNISKRKELFIYDKESKNNVYFMTHAGSLEFSAPELLNGARYTEQVDLWSAGMILYYMLTGVKPFKGKKYFDFIIIYILV